MNKKFFITDQPDAAEIDHLSKQLNKSIKGFNLINEKRDIAIFKHDNEDRLVAGITGHTFWDWLYIKLLWVHDTQRKKGLGKTLVTKVEDIAKNRGCHFAWVDTFSFQAPEFYKKLGYKKFGELKNFPGKEKRFFFKKSL